jgi:hypothetical protein
VSSATATLSQARTGAGAAAAAATALHFRKNVGHRPRSERVVSNVDPDRGVNGDPLEAPGEPNRIQAAAQCR